MIACECVGAPWCTAFQKYSPNIAAKCVTLFLTTHSCLADVVRLTFRNDIRRSMPSVSNLRGGVEEREGGGERAGDREVSRGGG